MMIHSTTACNGLLVVRLPQWNGGSIVMDREPLRPPRIGDMEYWGVQRLPWEDIEQATYSLSGLPREIANIRDRIIASNADVTGLELCKDIGDATTMLNYSNRTEVRNELIVVHADWLNEVKGKIRLAVYSIQWLGYDVVAAGSWSLIADGCFRDPHFFREWSGRLNSYGLLSDCDEWGPYANFYQFAAQQGVTEPVPDGYFMGPIRVGRYVAS